MNPAQDLQTLLAALSVSGEVTYRDSKESAVTTNWRVQWDADMIARDLMQNFVDANKNAFDAIAIRRVKTVVTVTAPAEFDLQRLYYLGSEKEADDIGQFGEGFKAAAVCLLRDARCSLYCVSGGQAMRIRLATDPVPGSDMRPLTYDFFTLAPQQVGTTLIVTGGARALATAIEKSKEHFEWDGHPQFGELIWRGGSIAAYHAKGENGAVFYRGLRRGEFKHFPVILTLGEATSKVERLIATDRDRKAFGPEVIDAFVSDFFGKKVYPGAFTAKFYLALLEAGKAHWRAGHPIFKTLAEKRPAAGATLAETSALFEEDYYARDRQSYGSWEDRAAADEIARTWDSAGRLNLPNYFTAFGALEAAGVVRARKRKLLADLKQSKSRPPSDAELDALKTLERVLATFAPEIQTLFLKLKRQFLVAESDVILGELRAGRGYNEKIVLLSASVFVDDFAAAVATYLHEHAHILGYDGSRPFTDALTVLIETILRRRAEFAPLEADWSAALEKVQAERAQIAALTGDAARLAHMDEKELRALLARIPKEVLENFIEAHADS